MTTDTKQIRADVFEEFCKTIEALRDPTHGCPWDLEQTHETLRRYMIEEAYEAAEVMHPVDEKKLCEELGDVLLQVVLNAQLAKDSHRFSIIDVIKSINEKMRRRHPHVFGDSNNDKSTYARDKLAIKAKWDEVKSQESEQKSGKDTSTGFFDHLKTGSITPSSQLALQIGKTAKKISFDWPNPVTVFQQVESEIKELKHELTVTNDKEKIKEELGDVFFSLNQLCRHLDIDPEICSMDGNHKFLRRFRSLERIAQAEQVDITSAGPDKLEDLWRKAKALEDQSTI
jgi:MazG family protein